MSTSLRVKSEPHLLWRCWDGEYAVYCAETGHTHHLEGLAAEIFERLLAQPAADAALLEAIAASVEAAERSQLHEAVPQTIARLLEAELLERSL